MTNIILIRHGMTEAVGVRLAGRAPGCHLNARGREQAAALAERLAELPLAAVVASPMERTQQTAEGIARIHGLRVRLDEGFTEIDYGDWTGRDWASLADDPRWKRYNTFRSHTRIPGGETMIEVQARAVGSIDYLIREYPSRTVAVVSHCDVIKAILAHYTGIALDLFQPRLAIDPASCSVLAIDAERARLVKLNDTGTLAGLH